MQADRSSRLEIDDNVQGSGFIILFLTSIIMFFAFLAPQFMRRPKIIALTSSAALVLVSAYQFAHTLIAWIRESGAFAGLTSLNLAIVCSGALVMLVAGAIDRRAMRQYDDWRATSDERSH